MAIIGSPLQNIAANNVLYYDIIIVFFILLSTSSSGVLCSSFRFSSADIKSVSVNGIINPWPFLNESLHLSMNNSFLDISLQVIIPSIPRLTVNRPII